MFSLKCYSCVREDNPDALKYCAIANASSLGNNRVTTCSALEDSCAIVKTIRKDGSVTTFRRGCMMAKTCKKGCAEPTADGEAVCGSCCEEDLCNKGEGPKASELSGTSRITIIRGQCMLGSFLMLLLM